MNRKTLVVIAAAIVWCLAISAPAEAQTDRTSWGVAGTLVPLWETPPQVESLFETSPVDVSGSEFRIGVVRGRDFGGDWGVSFVRKRVDDESTIGELTQYCEQTRCVPEGEVYRFRDVKMTGIVLHKYIPFVTIKHRAQIGLTMGGGVARLEGSALGDIFARDFLTLGTTNFLISRWEPSDIPAEDLFVTKVVPLVDLQLSVAAIAAKGLKIRANTGINSPGYQRFSLTATYFFRSR